MDKLLSDSVAHNGDREGCFHCPQYDKQCFNALSIIILRFTMSIEIVCLGLNEEEIRIEARHRKLSAASSTLMPFREAGHCGYTHTIHWDK